VKRWKEFNKRALNKKKSETEMSSAANTLIQQSNAAFVEEDYQASLALLNQAIAAQDGSIGGEAFLKRSITHYKLGNYKESLDDALAAEMMGIPQTSDSKDGGLGAGVGVGATGGKDVESVRLFEGKAALRQGIALYELGRIEEAKAAVRNSNLQLSQTQNSKDPLLALWKGKLGLKDAPTGNTDSVAPTPSTMNVTPTSVTSTAAGKDIQVPPTPNSDSQKEAKDSAAPAASFSNPTPKVVISFPFFSLPSHIHMSTLIYVTTFNLQFMLTFMFNINLTTIIK
jgi:hypothetical protein